MKRREMKNKIQKEIESWFLHKYSHLNEYDIRNDIETELKNDCENAADFVLGMVENNGMLPPCISLPENKKEFINSVILNLCSWEEE